MSVKPNVPVDEEGVKNLLQNRCIHTHYQPIVSLMTKSVVGFEGFSRGRTDEAACIDPTMMFHPDLSPETKVQVDRMCREDALAKFRNILDANPELLLFVNINPAILAHVKDGSMVLKEQVDAAGIPPENVVIEIPARAANNMRIMEFAELYRGLGFKTGMDNCCIEDPFSTLLFALKPHFVKIGRSFYAENGQEHFSFKPLERLIEEAGKNGTFVIGQGVESEKDSFRLLMNDIQLQQGVYYTKDETETSDDPTKLFFNKIARTHNQYKVTKAKEVQRKKEQYRVMFTSLMEVLGKFEGRAASQYERICQTHIKRIKSANSIFILNNKGMQITSRAHIPPAKGRPITNGIIGFGKGVDHSSTDHVMHIDMGYPQFVTAPFTSPYTGDPACIIAKAFKCSQGIRHILCLEMDAPNS